MAKYAEGTNVSIATSRTEIERTLYRYGVTGFLYGEQGDRAAVAFELQGRRYRMELRYPPISEFEYTSRNVRRSSTSQKTAYDGELRRLWRGLVMIIKAKLEAVESGVTTLEDELMMHTVMPDNSTVSEWLSPQINEIYQSGRMPPLLPWVRSGKKALEGPILEGEVIS